MEQAGSASPDDPEPQLSAYEKQKRRAAKRSAEQSAKDREIGPLPPVVNPERKEACRLNLQLFLETYFPTAFPLAWSDDHIRVIKKVEEAVLHGGLFAMAMPRGSGKTTICERAVLWAVLYGHHKYAMFIASDQKKAKESLGKLHGFFETNELLLDDFPEAVFPIRALERIHNKAKGQTCQGEPTRIEIGKESITLPTIAGSAASTGVIRIGALLSAVRGGNFARVDGVVVRPTLVLLDDPQTRRSARSSTQTDLREQLVAADVLGLVGPDESISCLMTCTVIERNDLADRMLNRSLHPDWQGQRTKLLDAFPENMSLWEEYREHQCDLLAKDTPAATLRKKLNAWFREHETELCRGAKWTWPARVGKGPVHPLRFAMEVYFKNPVAFASEYQNEPPAGDEDVEDLQPADKLARRTNKIERGKIPLRAKHLTAAIDVHKQLLYWMICWWDDDFTGGVVDYGTFPDQGKTVFTLRQADPDLQKATGRKSPMAAVRAALDDLQNTLAARQFQRPDGVILKVERINEDANWGASTKTVLAACRESDHRQILRPCHGKGLKATSKPMSEWKTTEAEKVGHHWVRRPGELGVQRVTVDTNYWKSFVHDALALDPEEPHSLSLFKSPAHVHRLLSEHLTAETRKRVWTAERSVDIWEVKPGKPDNHWFDTLVLCAVGASEGCKIAPPGVVGKNKPAAKKRLTGAEIQALREARRRGR